VPGLFFVADPLQFLSGEQPDVIFDLNIILPGALLRALFAGAVRKISDNRTFHLGAFFCSEGQGCLLIQRFENLFALVVYYFDALCPAAWLN
jgi:hypothetical protein